MSILETLTQFLKNAASGDPSPPPSVFAGQNLEDLLSFNVSSWDDLTTWVDKLEALGDTLKDTLIVRVLQQHAPRIAEALAMIGIVGAKYDGDTTQVNSFTIDWHKLNTLMSNPASVVGDPNWWLSKIANLDSLKQMQVFLMLLVFSPKALLALEYARNGFFSLPQPATPINLNDLVNKLIGSPLYIQIPVPSTSFLTIDDLLASQPLLGTRDSASYLEVSAPNIFNPPADKFPEGVELGLHLTDVQHITGVTVGLGGGWQLSFVSPVSGVGTFKLAYHNGGWDHANGSSGDFTVQVRKVPSPGEPELLIGSADANVQIGRIGLSLNFYAPQANNPLFSVGIALQQVTLVLSINALKILAAALPIPPSISFSTDVLISYLQGVGFQTQAKLDDPNVLALIPSIVVPLDLTLGTASVNLTIERVTGWVEKKPNSSEWRVVMRASATAQFGPIHAIMDGFGSWFGNFERKSFGVLPPNGIGIQIDAGFIQGGGFLSVDTSAGHQRYAGALSLKLLFFSVFAFGIIEEINGKMSFIAVIGVRFPGGIQLSFGFMITGVGGLIGINRRADTDLLRERLASGASGNVLFCDDPVKNAPTLLGDLAAFFPAEPDVFIVGPTFQLSWMYIVRLDLGVFIELPGPRKIFIAGSARVLIGFDESAALIFLRMDFIGGIDFTANLIFFDAALVNSHVLGIISITGGMVFRLAYGTPSYFALSVGGFHPNFHPEPMNIPRIARVGASLSMNVVADIWLRLEMYVAFTTNTFQIGSSVEAGLELGPISAHGWFKFDALIQFKPFYFEATIDAGFDLEAAGISIASAHVSGTMVGPGPLVIHASASIRCLFVKISGSATFTLGDSNGDKAFVLATAFDELFKQIKVQNLRVEGEDRTVMLRPGHINDANIVLVSPLGSFIWEQKLAPLGTNLERFQGNKLQQVESYQVSSNLSPTPPPEYDQFGLGTFLELNQSQSLNTTVFETLPSGIHIASGYSPLSNEEKPDLSIQLVHVPARNVFIDLVVTQLYLASGVMTMIYERGTTSPIVGGAAKVSVSQEAWTAYSANGQAMNGVESTSQANAFQSARRSGGFAVSATEELVVLDGV